MFDPNVDPNVFGDEQTHSRPRVLFILSARSMATMLGLMLLWIITACAGVYQLAVWAIALFGGPEAA